MKVDKQLTWALEGVEWPSPRWVEINEDGFGAGAPLQPRPPSRSKQAPLPINAFSPDGASAQELLQRLHVDVEEVVHRKRRMIIESRWIIGIELEPAETRQSCQHGRNEVVGALFGPVHHRKGALAINIRVRRGGNNAHLPTLGLKWKKTGGRGNKTGEGEGNGQ